MTALEQIQDLVALSNDALADAVLEHRRLYYAGTPVLSDQDYDRLEEELRRRAPEHPIFDQVGSALDIASDLPKVDHATPMLSLDKTYVLEDLLKWRAERELVAAHKLDGNSLALRYRDGRLIQAATRGNGRLGEDVTEAARWIDSCLSEVNTIKDFPDSFEIRGELVCSFAAFARLTEEMLQLGLERPTNPRNIVSGVLGRKQHKSLARYFTFFAFDMLDLGGTETLDGLWESEAAKLEGLKGLGFEIPPWALLQSPEAINAYLQHTAPLLDEGDYAIDGVVMTLNDIGVHEELGSTAHHPRYRLAFKWQGATAQSAVQRIDWATSRLGIVTPVAVIEPVNLSGASITNVTLHNAAHVRAYDLKAGDQIEIVRSGEVIPKFLRVISAAPGMAELPEVCPSCGTRLVDDEVRLRCPNQEGCPAQVLRSILNWIRCVDIDDLSEKRLQAMIDAGFVSQISDLYALTMSQMLTLPLVKEKTATKLLANIAARRQVPMAKFLNGLGIAGMGLTMWEKLLERHPLLETVRTLSVEDIVEVEGFAELSAGHLVQGLVEKSGTIESLLAIGVKPTASEVSNPISGLLSAKRLVVTGKMSHPRKYIEQAIKDAGGTVMSAVSKEIDILVIADPNSTSSKAKKARDYGITMWSEEKLWEMLQEK